MWPPTPMPGTLGARDHHGRVPAGRVQDLALDLLVAGEERLVLGRDGVDVVRAAHLGHGHALLAGALDQAEHQVAGPLPAALVDGGVERVEPFLGLFGIEVRDLAGKAANDDRVAIGSGSHAVPSLFGRVVLARFMLRTGRCCSAWCRAVLHRVPRGRNTSSLPRGNRIRERWRCKGRCLGSAKSQPYAHVASASRTAVRTRIGSAAGAAKGPSAQYPINPAERCGVHHFGLACWGRVAARRLETSPFRRSRRPGTCAIRPARVDYGQCFAHARGLPSIFRNMTGGNP